MEPKRRMEDQVVDVAAREEIESTLAEIGLEDERIVELCQLARLSDPDALVHRLAGLREDLVRRMHESERRVDALDLLIFRIRQQARR